MLSRTLRRSVQWMVWVMFRFLLPQRYRVKVVGKSEVFKKPGPYLILPNHPAYVDPLLLMLKLWPAFRMRPLVLETNFQNPVMGPFGFLLNVIRMPDVVQASAETRDRAGGAIAGVVAALRRGENIILWPSGQLSRSGTERPGGARTAAEVLAAVPNVTVVLVRTRGLWGSMFGYADGEPSMFKALFGGLALWASNLFVFAPRRNVTVTLEAFTPDQRPGPTREAVNSWLESWYNADTPCETPTFVPRHFLFGPRTHEFPTPPPRKEFDLSKVKPETAAAVANFLEEKLKRSLDEGEQLPDTTFAALGLDSLDAMDVTLSVEKRFGHTSERVPESLGELWALADGVHEKTPPKPAPAGWFARGADGPVLIPGETVAEAFLNQAFANRKMLIVADDLAGGLTYEKLIVGASVMATRFHAIGAPNVGLMLPASAACDLAFLGLHLAGKVPVVLNWTTGPANLAHAVKLAGLTHVITSKAFLDRVQPEVPGVEFFYLESLRGSVGAAEKLRRALAVRLFGGLTRRRMLGRLASDPHKPAVILFTSGSEKAPKAVPLTHANIIANLRGCIDALSLRRDDSAIGFLPMFHSFGLTVTGLFPLFVGLRIVHHPDPTDAGVLVRKIANYKPTLIAGTPTFLGYILDRARPGDLDSLRLIVVGAEKCPDRIFEKATSLAPNAEVLEGYGITECSPVVSVNRPGRVKRGTIGDPLAGVEVRVVGVDFEAMRPTTEVLPRGEKGMLLVSGPTVFRGYLVRESDEQPSPFVTDADGKTWYVTGDLAESGEGGTIVFHGRLKRFVKSGGEMVSLPALEEPFSNKYPPKEKLLRVAVEGIETPSERPRIVLFTTEEITLREANALLQAEGFQGVMRLDDVRKIDAIPKLGNDKPDYKVLRAMIVNATSV